MINDHVPDGTFVKEVAALAKPEQKLVDLGDGRKLLVGYEEAQEFGEQLEAAPTATSLSTLDGIIDAYNANISKDVPVVINIDGPRTVKIIAPVVGISKQRFTYAYSEPTQNMIELGEFLPMEMLILELWTNYADTPGRARLLEFAGDLSAGLQNDNVDDGVTQTVTVKTGVRRSDNQSFQNPVVLQPFRTFPEIEQPESKFVFRMKTGGNGEDSITALGGLFEADGGAWRVEAIKNIKEYLRAQLPDAVILA